MKHKVSIYTLALLGALALAAVSGGLFTSSDNVVYADHINSPDNNAPTFPNTENGQRSVDENTPAGVNIGAPISATDTDGDTLTYTLGGTNADSFDIDESTGQLITKADLDAETTRSYSVTVTVDDGNSGTDTQAVLITVTDVAEQPAAPAPPVVTTGSTSGSETTNLEVNWYAPANTGPTISDYDYRYKKTTDTSWKEVTNPAITTTSATISGLDADTAYQVSVRATADDEGISLWSLSATGSTNVEGNAAPEFPSTDVGTRTVPENTPAGVNVGASVSATDTNSTTLTYSLAGADADSFDIAESTGQILTKAALNYEGKTSYTVMVVVEDGDGGSNVKTVMITVTDVLEPPSRPDAPTVIAWDNPDTTEADESTTTLEVSWVAPDTTGPDITNYDLQYREGTSGAFMDGPQNVDGTSTMIVDRTPGTTYQVRVKATGGDEGNSQWSREGTGMTNAANNAPTFSTQSNERNVLENTPTGRNIGAPITATDDDSGDRLTYSLDQVDAATFDVDKTNGQLRTKASLDYEATPSYNVTVTATDSKGSADTATVNIAVQDVNEPPLAPSMPTLTAGSDTSLVVAWAAPGNEGRPRITSFEVECSGAGCPQQALSYGETVLNTTIMELTAFTRYTVRVRAINNEGNGPWASGSEYTNKTGNTMPVFDDSDPARRSVAENTQRGQPVGTAVRAQDSDNDDLTYSLGGVHAALFDIDSSTGQIKVKADLNHEAECSAADANTGHEDACTYSVDVKVVDGNGGSDTISVTITVTDVLNEASSAPPRPTVRAAQPTDDEPNLDPTTMLSVSWVEPQNAGPAITSYVVQYKVSVGGSWESSADNVEFDNGNTNDGTTRGATITGLDHDTTYEVQVRATNAEDESSWSDSGTGKTHFANARPRFNNRSAVELHVDENTPSGQTIGVPVDASDVDGHVLTYTLEGVHKDLFSIQGRSGHIFTGASLDYEARRSYSLTVKADDGRDADNSSATTSVTITVRDQDESPLRPAAPTVSGIAGSTSNVRVTWDEPLNDGPSIVDYDVQYRTGGGGFKPWNHEGTDTSTIIMGMSAGTSYEVQVRASNGEGRSEWSASGSGSPDPDETNNPPAFSGGPRTFSVAENTAAGANIGSPVTATDPDRDPLTYTLEGTDAASFDIAPIIGQIRTRSPLNHEAKSSYAVTVKADDRRGGADTIRVTITVTDVDGEAPATPAAPTVAAASSTSLAVSWDAPENTGPPITDYDVQYRDASSSFTSWPHNGAGRSATITGLTADTSYDVQVLATNAEGTSGWSSSGFGRTNAPGANTPPVFREGASATRSVTVNAPANSPIGLPVTATDSDPGTTLNYTLEGADAASFGINASNGQLLTKVGVALSAGTTYTVVVVASDGIAEARITVTVTISVVTNSPPTFSASSASRSVAENTPAGQNVGIPVSATDANSDDTLTYRLSGANASSFDIVSTTGQIQTKAALDYETRIGYTVTVTVSDGEFTDSITVTITVTDMHPGCATAIGNGANTGLANDCEALLDSKDALQGTTGSLNWATHTPIAQWDGIYVNGSPKRVMRLTLRKMPQLNGTIPGALGRLSGLENLSLYANGLTGPIPAELGNLSRLKVMYINNNKLSGTIPAELGNLNNLERLWLHRNSLSGSIPTKLSDLSSLQSLSVYGNDLSGSIPTELGDLTNLKVLYLHANKLSGSIPTELGRLTNLQLLYLWGNDLTGAIPTQLGGLSNLRVLSLGRNRLTGAIPTELGNLSNLERLYVYGDKTRSLSLDGGIPTQLGNLTKLTTLVLQYTGLTGEIPTELGNMTDLEWLNIQNNQLNGSIPMELGGLSNLKRLYLHYNRLSGAIPSELGNLSELTNLWLKSNQLSGDIPPELGNLQNLERVRISRNLGLTTGCVPAALTDSAGIDSDAEYLNLPTCQ